MVENGKKVNVHLKVHESLSDFCDLNYCLLPLNPLLAECFMLMMNSSEVDLERFLSGTFIQKF